MRPERPRIFVLPVFFSRQKCHRQARRPTAGITPTMWDHTAWRRPWAKDRQVSDPPRHTHTRARASDAVRALLGITVLASLTSLFVAVFTMALNPKSVP